MSRDGRDGSAIEDKYTRDEIIKKFVVVSYDVGFRVYSDLDVFWSALPRMETKTWNEVIFNVPQKLKLDIDAPADKVSDYGELFKEICSAVHDAFFTSYGFSLQESDLIITSSHKTTTDINQVIDDLDDNQVYIVKYSNHIIIDNYYVTSAAQAREFTRRITDIIPNVSVIDNSVNKDYQNFRIVTCSKLGEPQRIKSMVTQHDPKRTIITNIDGCTMLPDLITIGDVNNKSTTKIDTTLFNGKIDLEAIIAAYAPNDHKFRRIRGNKIEFNRIRPSMCDLCNREHTTDNTFYIELVEADDGSTIVYRKCRKFDGSGVLLEATSRKAQIGGQITRWINGIDSYLRFTADVVNGTVLRTEYAEPALRPFELVPTLVVKAFMKMGKTKTLMDYIKSHFPSGLVSPCIRFISFRQTFSANIREKFPDFVVYSDVRGTIYANKLIIQVESLHRLGIQPGGSPPDLLVLDECESIFEQFDSGLLKQFGECFAKFQYLLKFSKHVVCMDANVSQRTLNILCRHRGIVHMHINTYQNARDDTVYMTTDKAKWLGALFALAETDKCAIASSSLVDAKAICDVLRSRNPDKKIGLYSSETSQKIKNEHFADVNTYWAIYDILIYTPTVSAGVSFEAKHFNKMFGLFTSASCPVETCTQMLGRIRDVADKIYFIYLDIDPVVLPHTTDRIRELIRTKRESLHNTYDNIGLTVQYAYNGQIELHESDYFQIYLENTRLRNISKSFFGKQFIYRMMQPGAHIEELTDEIYEELIGEPAIIDGEYSVAVMEALCACKDARKETKEEAAVAIAMAPDITDDEAYELASSDDLTESERSSLARHRLRRHYDFKHDITSTFAKTYTSNKLKRNYKNLIRIAEGLDKIKDSERERFTSIHEAGEKCQHLDLRFRYVYDQHRYAIAMLKICGWSSITDTTYKHISEFNLDEFFTHIRSICAEFGLRFNAKRDDIGTVVALINRILSIVYGISVRRTHENTYRIVPNNKFTTNVNSITKPIIPTMRPT